MKKNNKTSDINLLHFVSRGQLAQKLNVSTKTIKRYVDRYKDDIQRIDPTFVDRHNFSPIITRFLYEKFFGETPNEQDKD